MSVRVAKSAGFCFGVSRAVELVQSSAAAGKRTVTLGPIIHNRHVVEAFHQAGVGVIDSPEEANPGDTVIIRSHGVGREVYARLEAACFLRSYCRNCRKPYPKPWFYFLAEAY